jgi:hypothetical protein
MEDDMADTTQVRMLVTISGTRDGADWPARGELATLPTDEAAAMVAGGLVEIAAVEPGGADVETAADTAKPSLRGARKGGAA